MILPMSKEEAFRDSKEPLDVILVSSDAYIDSPYIGIAIIGTLLSSHGYRVGVIAQPDIDNSSDITELGEPRLFWGVSGGSVDSMVANYTPLKKRRKSDDYTPGGVNNKRPDRATIAYSNLIRKYFKKTAPIVLGGIEASLRRISHYDFWSDKIRRSILFDAKADYLLYGMAERSVLELAEALQKGRSPDDIRGLCYISKEPKEDFLELPSHNDASKSNDAFRSSFEIFYKNSDAKNAKGFYQQQDSRFLIHNPPPFPLNQQEIDNIYNLPFSRDAHPSYKNSGKIKAIETIKFSITTHRGCYGECSFCAITLHQGRTIQSRSHSSILKEAVEITKLEDFKGYIDDVGGPTANMYDFECDKKLTKGSCQNKPCVGKSICNKLPISHKSQIELLGKIRSLKGVKKVFVRSGIRYDLLLSDRKYGKKYLEEIIKHHTSGQLKIAPEHSEDRVLALMNKPSKNELIKFKKHFDEINSRHKKRQFLTYYFIAAHPGSTLEDMKKVKHFTSNNLKINPKQIQIFTPTPSTYSTLMYRCKTDMDGNSIFVDSSDTGRARQKSLFNL